jgi:Nif-specific regulatory protein
MAHTRDEVPISSHDLQLLHAVNDRILQIENLEELLKAVLSEICGTFDIEGASIALHDAQARELCFLRTVEQPGRGMRQTMEQMRFPDHVGIGGWVLHHNQTAVVPDVVRDSRFFGEMNSKGRFRTRSMICVPLRARGKVIGLLYALNRKRGNFSDKDARQLEIVASPIAVAIENARQYGLLFQYASDLEQENSRLQLEARERFGRDRVLGSSPAMKRVFSLVAKVTHTRTPVLLVGATGTGKEVIARMIHYNGPLRDRPFVAESCGAIAENLMESELFGHVRGAFTGAVEAKKGLFQAAGGGTVYLDEISDMPKSMQAKLLRVLQENQVRPVGSSQVVPVRFRLIASTNRDLHEAAQAGDFRADLLYRLHVFPIELPSLKARGTDIALLAAHFLALHARNQQRAAPVLSPAALDRLMAYDWPGNVRELEHEMERALCLAEEGAEIGESLLSERVRQSAEPGEPPVPDAVESLRLGEAVEQLERRLITAALQRSGGNRSQASRLLGVTRQGLLNKLARYQITVT